MISMICIMVWIGVKLSAPAWYYILLSFHIFFGAMDFILDKRKANQEAAARKRD